ncbi:hypothetical protein LNN38_03895 [Pseudomonas sp. LA21]|uniref:hypothetical protein n=1 Tax=unclassified Pseudomonas TaxID=196821 RepID=UPI001A9FC646|nr:MULTISPECIES: hypothetical protein [unclassified Pseudomonas]MCJ1883983.1 hypothetical protein [Pseudomonas sp. LA21]
MSRFIPLLIALIICASLLTAHLMLCSYEETRLQAARSALQLPTPPCILGSCLRQLP